MHLRILAVDLLADRIEVEILEPRQLCVMTFARWDYWSARWGFKPFA